MIKFQIRPAIEQYGSFAEFVEEIKLLDTDCIFTVRYLFENWIEPLHSNSRVLVYEDYGSGEPSDEMIDRILRDFRAISVRRIIAIGGGSVMDVAKLLALKQDFSKTSELFAEKTSAEKEKQLVLLPTTCGTGSEATCISIAAIPSMHTKKGLAVPALFADRAVLIPELLNGLPRSVLITSSIDALTHAAESFVSPKANSYTELFSLEAVRLILESYKTLLSGSEEEVPKDVVGKLLTASNYAGIAFGNAGVGAVHALAYPLGETYHVCHGEACAQFFNAVFDVYKRKEPQGKLRILSRAIAQSLDFPGGPDPWEILNILFGRLLPQRKLRDFGMPENEIEVFSDSVVKEQQRLLVNNYIPFNRDEIRDIYRKLW